MGSKASIGKISFSDLVCQVIFSLREKLLGIVKEELELSLIALRDKRIGGKRYGRGFRLKRWGYTIRKYIFTPLGRIEFVRIPRVRDKFQGEENLFLREYVHFSRDLVEQLILAQAFQMSSRKVSIWFKSGLRDFLSYGSIVRLMGSFGEEMERIRERRIEGEVEALILDGLWGHFRGVGKGVILVVLGLYSDGRIELLDWEGSRGEDTRSWLRMLERLKRRGLGKVRLVVGDGSMGLPRAVKKVYPESGFQVCLWHFCQDLMRHVKGLSYLERQRLYHDFWEVFHAYDVETCYARYLAFMERWGRVNRFVEGLFSRYEENLFAFYRIGVEYRHRVRSVNMAESFFRHLREFLRRYPGWCDARHIDKLMGIFLNGIKVYRENFGSKTLLKGAFVYAK